MQIYGPFRIQPNQPDRGVSRAISKPEASPARTTSPIDELDISPEAQAASRLGNVESTAPANGEIRAEKVAAIRRAIADGTYDTPEKMDIALGRLLDSLG